MSLERLETFLEEQQQEDGKGEDALAGEVGGALAMPSGKAGVGQMEPEFIDHSEGAGLESSSLHPHAESRM